MNKARRTELDAIIAKITEVSGELESIMNDEEEYRDNIPENMPSSERYQNAESACDNLSSALDSLGEAVSYIEEAQA